MPADMAIHFGAFIRQKRVRQKKSIRKLAAAAGVTEKRLWAIEGMAQPKIYDQTKEAIASALGMTSEQLDEAWQATPVPVRARATDPLGRLEKFAKRLGLSPAQVVEHFKKLSGSPKRPLVCRVKSQQDKEVREVEIPANGR
jgi:transcriptional regulator with XRE-family HTH domain